MMKWFGGCLFEVLEMHGLLHWLGWAWVTELNFTCKNLDIRVPSRITYIWISAFGMLWWF
jgi:hypothetical protein